MKDTTEGIYFDGVSSRPYPVFISLKRKTIIFWSPEIPQEEWTLDEITADVVSGRMSLHLKTNKVSSLIIEDNLFRENFFRQFNRKGEGLYQKLIHAGALVHISIAAGLLAILICSYFFFIPWLADRAVNFIPISYDEKLGNTVYKNIISNVKIDGVQTETVNEFASKINFHTTGKLRFIVVESNDVNAFALPDGSIIINTGILRKMTNYKQLAALMGHEAAHYTLRHSMRSLSRSLSGYILISLITTDVNGIMAVMADNANQLNNLSFSRSFESEADKRGFETLTSNRIDPNGMTELFKILKGAGDHSMPTFLSTHPLTDERIDQTSELIDRGNYEIREHEDLSVIFSRLKADSSTK